MNSMATGQVPIALVVFFVFWYLNEQSRTVIFGPGNWRGRVHAALRAGGGGIVQEPFGDPFCVELADAGGDGDLHLRLDPADEEAFHLKWQDVALTAAGVVLVGASLRAHMATGYSASKRLPCRSIYSWKSGWPRFCCIAPSIFTVMRFAGIP